MTENAPTVTAVRRALVAESDDYYERRQPYFQAMHDDNEDSGNQNAAHDVYEGFVTAGSYAWLLAALLRRLVEDHGEEYAAKVAAGVKMVMDEGIDWLEDANSDLDSDTAPAGA